jgi:hypothetical protein
MAIVNFFNSNYNFLLLKILNKQKEKLLREKQKKMSQSENALKLIWDVREQVRHAFAIMCSS